MQRVLACLLFRGEDFYWIEFPIIFGGVLILVGMSKWRFFLQWARGISGRDWPTVAAIVDIVTVVPNLVETRDGEQIDGYLATLTYFYRNPDLQTDDSARCAGPRRKRSVGRHRSRGVR